MVLSKQVKDFLFYVFHLLYVHSQSCLAHTTSVNKMIFELINILIKNEIQQENNFINKPSVFFYFFLNY